MVSRELPWRPKHICTVTLAGSILEQRWHSKKPRCSFSGFRSLAMVVIKHTHTQAQLETNWLKGIWHPSSWKQVVHLNYMFGLFVPKAWPAGKGRTQWKNRNTGPDGGIKSTNRASQRPNEPETSTAGSIRPDHPSILRSFPLRQFHTH